jgi:hypothetical protein
MKVLSIKEPYATLICNGNKYIETRSWKTKYRGELFIHASGKKLATEYITNSYVLEIIQNMDMNFGNIICRGDLVDCIYMDEKFLQNIKQNDNEYNLGLYELGRYAWVFENIEPIKPIPAKGNLNIWNYDGEYEMISKHKTR